MRMTRIKLHRVLVLAVVAHVAARGATSVIDDPPADSLDTSQWITSSCLLKMGEAVRPAPNDAMKESSGGAGAVTRPGPPRETVDAAWHKQTEIVKNSDLAIYEVIALA